jgi:hypothetical protein
MTIYMISIGDIIKTIQLKAGHQFKDATAACTTNNKVMNMMMYFDFPIIVQHGKELFV